MVADRRLILVERVVPNVAPMTQVTSTPVTRTAVSYGISNLGWPPIHRGWWGHNPITPDGPVRFYANVKADPKVGRKYDNRHRTSGHQAGLSGPHEGVPAQLHRGRHAGRHGHGARPDGYLTKPQGAHASVDCAPAAITR